MRALVIMLVACASPSRGPIDTVSFGQNTGGPDIGGINHEGVEHYRAGRLEEAIEKFRHAVASLPDPRYFFNLCLVLGEVGKLEEACQACVGAFAYPDDAHLVATRPRLQQQLAHLEATAAARHTPLACDRSTAR